MDPEGLNQQFSLDEFRRAFPTELLNGVRYIMFCGDIGDPIYNTDLLDIVHYTKINSGASLRIVTNGSYKEPHWWTQLGRLLSENDIVTFSVDGWDNESNNLYRVNSNWESIILGAKALRQASYCYMRWSTINFSFNQDRIHDIRHTAKALGFNDHELVNSSKFDHGYLVDGVDPLKPAQENVAKTSQYERQTYILNRRQYDALFQELHSREFHPWARCMNWKKEMFINVEGYVFPCPWFNTSYHDNYFVEKYKDRLCVKTRPLTEILQDELWEELYTTFEIAPMEICRRKCMDCHE
jgi:MoaA/NifB/PqqE/SkfB family radical SAM enzyme